MDDPSDDGAATPPRSRAARYRAALRRATLRRERAAGTHVLVRWSWILPWAVFICARIALAALGPVAGAGPDARAPEIASSISTRAPPAGDDPRGYPLEPTVVIVSRVQILLGDDPHPVLMLPPRDEMVRAGVGAKYKPGGPESMLVAPLADAIQRELAARRAAGEKGAPEAFVVMDRSLPYRLLVDVLYTLGQSGIGNYHLMVRSGIKKP